MRNRPGLQHYVCAGCGKTLERYPSQVLGKQRIFHSVECKDSHPNCRHERPPQCELEAVYAECRSFRDVAEVYETSYSTVQGWMARYGIKPHRVAAERRVTTAGYVVVKPEQPSGEWSLEHRVVWERANGPIPPNHTIHHINANRADNRLENLQLWEGSHPVGRRVSDPHCATCTCYEHHTTDDGTVRSEAMIKPQS